MEKKKKETVCKNAAGDVWVFAQVIGEHLHPVVYELLGEGKKLVSETGGELCAVFIGMCGCSTEGNHIAEELITYGADIVYWMKHELLENYSTDGYTKVIAELIEKECPEIFLIGGTDLGRDLAPRVAARVKTGLTVDCTAFKIEMDTRDLCQIRPAFGSQLMVEIVTNKRRPQMCTVRNGMFEKAEKDIMHKGLIFPVDVNLQSFDIHTKVVKKFKDTEEKFSLLDAKVVVAGGMGIGSKEGFKLLEQLAETLHGVVGGTRAVTAAEWIPHDRMIGQTGLVISPDLYIACGISGAIQHMLGVSGAKCVVAINNNPDAPIFKEADYGVVADYKDFIPKLIEKLKERKTF